MTAYTLSPQRDCSCSVCSSLRWLRGVLASLKRGDCWCGIATGNPLMREHSPVCVQARETFDALQDVGP